MPLLNRKEAWRPLAQPEGLQPEEEVWHIESTGEVFRSYEAYLQRMELYKQGVWSCKYTGKGGLTFEEAQQAEAKAVKQLDSFPKEHEERVCRSVHHSLAKVDELVASIYDALRPAAPAEAAQQAEQAEQQPSPFGSKENEPQQGGAAAAAAPAGEKPAGSGGEAPAAEAAAAAGEPDADAAAGGAAEPATAKKPEAEGEAAGEGKAAGEAKSSRKPKTPRAPISKQLLRIFIIENAEQQGPEHATKQVWVVKPELRQRFGLAEEVPEDIQAALAASVKAPKRKLEAPKGLGTKLPSKKDKKDKAAAGGEAAAAAAAGGEGGATPAAAKKEKEAVPMQRVEAKSWEELEKQYKEGSLKHIMAAVLKAVQPDALNVQGIIDKAKELGIKDAFEDKDKARMANLLSTDPNFIRLAKGAYSLHCFHPDKEQLVRVQPPKEPKSGKKAAGAAGDSATPAAGGEGGEGGATPAAAKKEKEAVPMQRVEAKSLEEVEKQYREGTLKAHIVAVLKAVQPEALTVQGVLDKAKELGIEGLEEKGKAAGQAMATDPNFIRLAKGAYSLHCFHPDKEQLVRVQPPKEKKEKDAGEGATPAAPGEGERQPEKESVPMIAVEAKSWEEVEKQYREGTLKAHIVAVLKAVQPEALTTQGIIDKGKELGLHEFEEKQKAAIGQAMATDPNFIRLTKGAYSLHCFHPDKPNLIRDPAHKKRKMTDFLEEDEGGSKRHEGSAAAGGDQEVDSITRAEQLVRHTKRSLARHREALEKAQAEYDAAKAKWEEEKKLGKATPSKEAAKERRLSDVAIPPEQLAQFEVSEEERTFKGEADDRKGMLEHRQKLQARVKELEKAKKAFIEAERKKREAAAREAGKEAKAVEVAFRKAEKQLEHERRATESAEKAAAAAEKKLEKEKEKAARGEERAKEREEREKQKAVEREERERRRAEKAKEKEEAKRYPLEDLELLEELRQKAAETGEAAPPEDVAQPNWLAPEDSHRLSTSLYVSDLVTQFAKQLGVKALHYDSFEKVLADATGKGERPAAGEELSASTLHTLYERLIEVILEDLRAEELATPQEKRWALLLGAGTWPEVLRRLVLTRAADEDNPDQRPDQPAVMAASMLAFDPVDHLTHDQHLALLRFLCDSVLDTDKMRGILQRRQDEAEDAMRDVRGEVAEQRKQLKELLDAEKEERRRKREERRKEEEEKAAAAAAAAGTTEGGGEGQAAEGSGEGKEGDSAAAPMEVDGQEQQEQEPSFELPERLCEYTGPADDRKALVQWRQEQQAEKRRLEKERKRWMGEQLRRQRELEAKEKAARAELELREKEKREMFEAIELAQEELEEKLEKYATRRLPLGFDRHQRRYWWGLAGHRPVVWVEDAEGRWGSYGTANELELLMASLDRRGVRELALVEALEKKYNTITGAMARAERAAAAAEKAGAKGADKEKEKERAEPPRRSGRTMQQVDFFDPAKAAKSGGASAGLAALFGPAEVVAAEAAADTMQELQKGAAGAHVEAPAGYDSWKDWASAVKAAAAGELEESSEAPTAAALRSLLQGKLQQLEEALLAASVGGLAADGDESEGEGSGEAGEGQGSEGGSPAGIGGISRTQSAQVLPPEEVVDDLFSPTKRHEARYLWKTQRERSAWLTDLRQAATAARIAYSAAVLEQQAEPMLASLAKAGAKGSGGKKGGKAAAAGKAGGAGGSKAAAAAGSRPVSRANSAANLEAAAAEARGSGKGSGKAAAAASGKRRAPPLPDNMRQTRSRH